MEVNKELIKHVANIARIKLKESEIEKFTLEFKEILTMFSEIDKIQSQKDIAIHPSKIENQLREDKVEKSLPKEKIFSNTHHKERGFFKGPWIK